MTKHQPKPTEEQHTEWLACFAHNVKVNLDQNCWEWLWKRHYQMVQETGYMHKNNICKTDLAKCKNSNLSRGCPGSSHTTLATFLKPQIRLTRLPPWRRLHSQPGRNCAWKINVTSVYKILRCFLAHGQGSFSLSLVLGNGPGPIPLSSLHTDWWTSSMRSFATSPQFPVLLWTTGGHFRLTDTVAKFPLLVCLLIF